MRTSIKKWGNGAALRIPKPLLEECKLTVASAVDMRVEKGRIVIEPIEAPKYNLDDLLSQITPENTHQEIDLGIVGKELL